MRLLIAGVLSRRVGYHRPARIRRRESPFEAERRSARLSLATPQALAAASVQPAGKSDTVEVDGSSPATGLAIEWAKQFDAELTGVAVLDELLDRDPGLYMT